MPNYGWIPILTSEIMIEENLFSEIASADGLVTISRSQAFTGFPLWTNLSDIWLDRLLGWFLRRQGRDLHKVDVKLIGFSKCKECKATVLTLEGKVVNFRGKPLVQGHAKVHETGLVRYDIDQATTDLDTQDAVDTIHVVVRDVFHRHVHHATDLALPTVEAQNETAAKQKLFNRYQEKFIVYKSLISRGLRRSWWNILFYELKGVYGHCCRAKGEICYMKSLCQRLGLEYQETVSNIECSFNTLDKRICFEQSRLDHLDTLIMLSFSAAAAVAVYYSGPAKGEAGEIGWWAVALVVVLLPAIRAIRGVIR